MASAVLGIDRPKGISRVSRRDAIFIALAGLHGIVLLIYPTAAIIAAGVWWNSNTIAHNFIHRPFFRSHLANRWFSGYLSILLGIPQALWRDRHLAHHAEVRWRLRVSRKIALETVLVLCLWAWLASAHPHFFGTAYLPGYGIGLALCALQGHYEHARGDTSHYGRIYNWLCFNDGYHAEHHAYPGAHWNSLPTRTAPAGRTSQWPAPLRWMEGLSLEGLERLVLRSPWLQRILLASHRQAFLDLLPRVPLVKRVVIVGGGLFPRTALILREVLPEAHITIVDASRANLDVARRFLGQDTEIIHRRYLPNDAVSCDLLVIPLSFEGDREQIYRYPPAPAVLVHDWIWHRRQASSIISIYLLKRLNLIQS